MAIKCLRTYIYIVIKPADKDSAIVMDKSAHIQEQDRQLIPTSMKRYMKTPLVRLYRVNLHVQNMLERGKSLKIPVHI